MPRASPPKFSYWVSELLRFLHANDIGCSAHLLDASFFGNCIPFLNCKRPSPKPSPDVSVSRYSYSFLQVEGHGSIFRLFIIPKKV